MSGSGVQEVLADSADDIREEKKEEMPDISETNNLGSSWTLLEKEEQDDDKDHQNPTSSSHELSVNESLPDIEKKENDG